MSEFKEFYTQEIDYYKGVVESYPFNKVPPFAYYCLAFSQYKAGLLREAAVHFEDFLAVADGDPKVKHFIPIAECFLANIGTTVVEERKDFILLIQKKERQLKHPLIGVRRALGLMNI